MTADRNVLIVDDNKLLCWGLEKLISAPNMLVKTVNNGKDALSAIYAASYHSAFLDVDLPDISGLEVLKEIKKTSPGTKVIVMTADNTEDNRKEALDRGAYHFIAKPFSVAEIKEVLQDVLASNKKGVGCRG